MASIRKREAEGPPITGYGTWQGIPIQASQPSTRWTCEDVVGNKGGTNPFELYRMTRSGGMLTGNRGGFIPNGMPVQFQRPGQIVSPVVNQATYANRVLSQTGPLTPKLYTVTSVFELRDIPKMLRHAGNLILKIKDRSGLDPGKELAAGILAKEFGWEPLLEDIGKMLDFADTVAKRQRVLKGAHTTRGIRRRVILDSNTKTQQGKDYTWSTYNLLSEQRYTQVQSYKRWATMQWTVKDQTQIGYEPTFQEGFRTAFGLNRGHLPISAWKALPWTWAIDWFADVSNVLAANYNMIYYQPSRFCVMTHAQGTRTYHDFVAGTHDNLGRFNISGGFVKEEWKRRVLLAPDTNISLKLPFLDSFKLSIVGSMSILATRRR